MKKILLLLFIAVQAYQATAQCTTANTTHTDWQSYTSPANGTFQQNTFDWTALGWSNYVKIGNQLLSGSVSSPYYSPTMHPYFASNANSDFKPQDGWELIKQDMGYFYSASTHEWNGNPMGNVPPYAGDPRLSPSQLNYLLLYNKYSGLLRVMVYINNANQYNTIYVKMRFLETADFANTPGYQPKVNALFNHYNPVTIALDKQTSVTEISAPAKFPSSSDAIYADFQLSYDPCICLFQSGMEVSFYSIQHATLIADGSSAGATFDIADVNSNMGTIYGNATGEDFVASMFENGGSPQAMIQSYNNSSALEDDANTLSNNAIKEDLEDLSSALEIAGNLATSGIFGEVDEILKQGLEKGSKALDFFSGRIKDDNTSTKPQLQLTSSYIKMTGSITSDPQIYNGLNFRYGVPGSLPSTGSTSLPEYAPVSNGEVLPNYPMYNDAVGLFALLSTPKINHYTNNTSIPQNIDNTNPSLIWVGNVTQTGTDQYAHVIHEYGFPSGLTYAFNPIVNAANTKVYAGLQIEGMPSDDHNPMFWDTTGTNNVNGVKTGFYGHKFDGMTYFDEINYGIYANGVQGYDAYYRYRTAFYPINCLPGIATRETYIYHGAQSQYVSNLLGDYRTRKVTLILLIEYEFNPDQYGKVHHSTQILKYDCPLNSYPIEFANSRPGYSASLVPTNLTINATNYATAKTIYSYGTVTVNGLQKTTSTGKVTIEAQDEVHLTNGSTLTSSTGDLVYKIQQFPDYFAGCEGALAQSNTSSLHDYCTNSNAYAANGYQANQRSASRQGQTTSSGLAAMRGGITKVNVFPNPSTGVVYINYSEPEPSEISISISDLEGESVHNARYTTAPGNNNYKLDLSNLTSGMYIINISNKNGTVKQDKLILYR